MWEWVLRRSIALRNQLRPLNDFAKFVWIRAKLRWVTGQFAVGPSQYCWSASRGRLVHAACDGLRGFWDGNPSRDWLPIVNHMKLFRCWSLRETIALMMHTHNIRVITVMILQYTK